MAIAQRAAHNGQKAPIHAPQPAPDAAQLERDDAQRQEEAVGKSYPAVDESSPSVETFVHGIYFWRGG